jgi:hypothetical protein
MRPFAKSATPHGYGAGQWAGGQWPGWDAAGDFDAPREGDTFGFQESVPQLRWPPRAPAQGNTAEQPRPAQQTSTATKSSALSFAALALVPKSASPSSDSLRARDERTQAGAAVAEASVLSEDASAASQEAKTAEPQPPPPTSAKPAAPPQDSAPKATRSDEKNKVKIEVTDEPVRRATASGILEIQQHKLMDLSILDRIKP